MKLSNQIRPISYLKAHAAEIVRNLSKQKEPLIITQNGQAKVVIQDIESYEQTQQTISLLKILSLGVRQIEEGKVLPAEEVIKSLRERQEDRWCRSRFFLTKDAARDLNELYDYIAVHDSPRKADYVLKQIETTFYTLSEFPERGVYPKELLQLGIREYREIFFKPYRIIYRVMDKNVYVLLIVDGRRDMQSLLQRRLLGA